MCTRRATARMIVKCHCSIVVVHCANMATGARLTTICVGVLEVLIKRVRSLIHGWTRRIRNVERFETECCRGINWSSYTGIYYRKAYGLMAPFIWLSSLCDRGGRKEMTAIWYIH